jgi:hypothetical protein
MKQDDVVSRWIKTLSDQDLLAAFDRALADDQFTVMWRLVDEIEQRRLEI